MKTKEEVIKEAYFELFDGDNLIDKEKRFSQLKSRIDSYGWLSGNIHNCKEALIDRSGHELRPKSLAGIENNNGWIKIESEDDLPKEVGSYLIQYEFKSGHKAITCVDFDGQTFWNFGDIFRIEIATHYQPIVKPNPPLY